MLRFGDKEIAEEKFYTAKKPIKIWDVNVENIVISKLINTKPSSKYLIGIKFDKAIRALILIMPKRSGYVKTFKVEDNSWMLSDSKKTCDSAVNTYPFTIKFVPECLMT